MLKKVLAVILVTVMGLSLVACAGTTEETTKATAAATTAAATTKAEATEAAATTAAAEATEAAAGGIDMSALKGMTVGFSQCDNANSWRITETDSMQQTADQYGVTLVYTDASGDIAKQASDIEDMVAQGVDYLVVAPQEEDGLQSALKSAMDAGIPVILVDRGINGTAGTDYTTSIMSDFVWEAQQVANKFIEVTGGKGNCVILEGTQGATSTNDRQSGFVDAIAGTDIVIVADQVANYTMAEGQAVMENILQAQGDTIDMVFCHNDDMALGAIQAIKAAGYEPGVDILVAGIDGPAAAMEAILAGELLCSCSCSPKFGPAAFETIARIEAGETVETSMKNADTLYDISNADVALGF